MTREEAIEILEGLAVPIHAEPAFDMAIEALKAQADLQPNCNELATDCISRQDAIDHWRLIIDATSTDSRYNMGFVDGLEFCISHLSTMPSAQPEHFADVSNMDDGELDFVQKHEKIPVELMVSAQPKPCEDAVSRQTLQKELALYPIDDVTTEDEAGYNRAINDVQKMVLHLPSAQQEEAIPATWLEEQAKWFESMDNAFAKIEANNIRVMIKKWRSEKDEQSDRKTGGD